MRAVARPLTIQILAQTSPDALGGGAVHARGLAEGLRGLGHRAVLLCTEGPANAAHDDHSAFDDVRICRPLRVPGLWRRPVAGAVAAWAAPMHRASRGVDAFIALSPALAVAARWTRPRTPRIYAPAVLLGRCGRRNLLEAAALRASGLLVSSAAVRAAFACLYGAPRGPVVTCPLGVTDARVQPVRRTRAALGVPADAFLILTVGSIDENKGQGRIAGALAFAAAHRPIPDWTWAVVGGGPAAAALAEEVERLGLRKRPAPARSPGNGERAGGESADDGTCTRLIGEDPHVADWYAAADVLVAASRSETFGLVIAEALAAGRPVVVPRNEPGRVLSPLAELVERCGLGRTFRHDSPDSLARALAELRSDPAACRAAGARAARLARRLFSWERYADSAVRLLAGEETIDVPWACAVGADPEHFADACAVKPHVACGG